MKIIVGPKGVGRHTLQCLLSGYNVISGDELKSLVDNVDILSALLVIDLQASCSEMYRYEAILKTKNIPYTVVLNKMDEGDITQFVGACQCFGKCVPISARDNIGIFNTMDWYNGVPLIEGK